MKKINNFLPLLPKNPFIIFPHSPPSKRHFGSLIVASNFDCWIIFCFNSGSLCLFYKQGFLLRSRCKQFKCLCYLFFITAFCWYYIALNPISSHSISHADKLDFIWMLEGRKIFFWKIDSKCEVFGFIYESFTYSKFFVVVIKATQKWDFFRVGVKTI